jgi:hypothetical protein
MIVANQQTPSPFLFSALHPVFRLRIFFTSLLLHHAPTVHSRQASCSLPRLALFSRSRGPSTYVPRFIPTDRPTCPASFRPTDLRARFILTDRPTPSTCGPPTDAFYVWTPDRRLLRVDPRPTPSTCGPPTDAAAKAILHSTPTLLLPFRLPRGSRPTCLRPSRSIHPSSWTYPTYATTTFLLPPFPVIQPSAPCSAPSGLPRGPRPTNSARNSAPPPRYTSTDLSTTTSTQRRPTPPVALT